MKTIITTLLLFLSTISFAGHDYWDYSYERRIRVFYHSYYYTYEPMYYTYWGNWHPYQTTGWNIWYSNGYWGVTYNWGWYYPRPYGYYAYSWYRPYNWGWGGHCNNTYVYNNHYYGNGNYNYGHRSLMTQNTTNGINKVNVTAKPKTNYSKYTTIEPNKVSSVSKVNTPVRANNNTYTKPTSNTTYKPTPTRVMNKPTYTQSRPTYKTPSRVNYGQSQSRPTTISRPTTTNNIQRPTRPMPKSNKMQRR